MSIKKKIKLKKIVLRIINTLSKYAFQINKASKSNNCNYLYVLFVFMLKNSFC